MARRRNEAKVVWPGFSNIPNPRQIVKVGRNEVCPCGSEKKYKDCHEGEGSIFLEKLARERNREQLKQLRIRLKKEGVPWYKRFFFRQ